MEGGSIGAVDDCCHPKGHKGFVACTQLAVTEDPRDEAPLILQLRVREATEPLWHRAERLSNLVEDLLSRHVVFLLSPRVQSGKSIIRPEPWSTGNTPFLV